MTVVVQWFLANPGWLTAAIILTVFFVCRCINNVICYLPNKCMDYTCNRLYDCTKALVCCPVQLICNCMDLCFNKEYNEESELFIRPLQV